VEGEPPSWEEDEEARDSNPWLEAHQLEGHHTKCLNKTFLDISNHNNMGNQTSQHLWIISLIWRPWGQEELGLPRSPTWTTRCFKPFFFCLVKEKQKQTWKKKV